MEKKQQRRRRRRNMTWQIVLILAAGSVFFGVLFGTERLEAGQTEAQETAVSQPETETQETVTSQPEMEAEKTAAQESTARETETQEAASQEAADSTAGTEAGSAPNSPEGYDYSAPVPEAPKTDSTWFDDAVFIGDSRTEGLILNTGLNNAIEYTHKGLMVDTVFTKPVIDMDGAKVTVMDALKTTQFRKVYIMLGINETGWPYNDVFIHKYGEVIDAVKEINPDAQIYVQQILPVSRTVSAEHSYIKNEKIAEYNALLQEMAEEKQVYFVAAAEAVTDGDGALPEDAAVDGIHLKKEYCVKWLEYLESHTVSAE